MSFGFTWTVTTLVPPETFDNAFSYKKVTNFLPENGPPALLRVVEEGATFSGYPS